jgi:hypothetical protein
VATPDPRLFELVTLLAEAGADWLGLEILNGVRNGLAVEESRQSLLNAQMAARFGRHPEINKERVLTFPLPQELHGDDQLTWAVAYVVERLTDEAEMLNTSFEELNVLAIGREPKEPQRQRVQRAPGVTLQVGEDGPAIETVDVATLRRDLVELNRALEGWLGTIRDRR